MQNAKPVVTPAVSRNDDESEEASAEEHRSLRRIVGKSQFLALRRPDIVFATNRLAKSLACPSKSDITASKRLLRYLRGTQDLGLKLQVQNRWCSTLTVFTDSDWAGDQPTRKSVSSCVIMLDGFRARCPCPNTFGGCSVWPSLTQVRRRKEKTYRELTGPGARARLVVLALEVSGRWSAEAKSFVGQLAKAHTRSEPRVLPCRMEQAWRLRVVLHPLVCRGSLVCRVSAWSEGDNWCCWPRADAARGGVRPPFRGVGLNSTVLLDTFAD